MSDLGDPVDITRQRELIVAVEFSLLSRGHLAVELFRAAGAAPTTRDLRPSRPAAVANPRRSLAHDVAGLQDLYPPRS